uniref:Fe2OG dioxygenase domain-containing protein n=1 Tax=Rhodosorus marinus TaxID=101924 RepID=A0A7S3EF57_9RHOD|mmetsp:Transcript_2752/g.12318  ORF Transcript_2752/g.12318 Transcript_2752/m.12318 type:complete len:454 (+) Transcript_2752:688-2049(+)
MSESVIKRKGVETGIRGLTLLEGFLTEAEEQTLLRAVDSKGWENLSKRRVQHHGYAFDYKVRGVNPREKIGPLPRFVEPIVSRLKALDDVGQEFDQLTVNEYVPGVGLSPHVDTHSMFTNVLASVSLAGHTVMEFRRGDEKQALLLQRRSVLILSGEARYAWRHYIPHRKTDPLEEGLAVSRPARRVSFTFRRIQVKPCNCDWPDECDTRKNEQLKILPGVEDEYVRRMYDAIAPHFSSTRFSRWPKVVEFLNSIDKGSVIADVGCGNGKYLSTREDCMFLASDLSIGLVNVCMEKSFDAVAADGLNCPYRDSSCDAAICIAVVHHISSVERRKRLVAEIARVLRRGGRALITAWAMEQEKPAKTIEKWEKIEGNDFFVPWHLPSHRTQKQHEQDPCSVRKTTPDDSFQVYKRYYHLFQEGELEALVNSVPGARAVDSFFDKSNWCVIFEATA